jgi:thioredoxin reductase
VPGVFAAGDVTGYRGPGAAAAAGAAAGQAIAAALK